MNRSLLAATAAAALAFPHLASASVVIDAFTDSARVSTSDPLTPSTVTQDNLAGVVGGRRSITVTDGSTTNASVRGTTSASSRDGFFAFGTAFDLTSKATVEYGDANSSLNVDFSGLVAMNLPFVSGDILSSEGKVECLITLTSAAGTADERSATSSLVYSRNSTIGDQLYPRSSFSGVDLSDVDRITLVAASIHPAPDVRFGAFSAVIPEPMSLSASACASIVMFRRRR